NNGQLTAWEHRSASGQSGQVQVGHAAVPVEIIDMVVCAQIEEFLTVSTRVQVSGKRRARGSHHGGASHCGQVVANPGRTTPVYLINVLIGSLVSNHDSTSVVKARELAARHGGRASGQRGQVLRLQGSAIHE